MNTAAAPSPALTAGHSVSPAAAWSLATDLPPVAISIELFPPKCASAAIELENELVQLAALEPLFFSVTCGAGGGGNDRTADIVHVVRDSTSRPVAAHMTCVGRSREHLEAQADAYWRSGVRHIVALRGDRPASDALAAEEGERLVYARDLIEALRRLHPFEISAACYPEVHPEARDDAADLDNAVRKVEAGADRLIGQYCFDTEAILRFRDALGGRGIDVPFVPGIMPIRNFEQIKRFSARCGAGIPEWLERLFDGVDAGSPLHGIIAASVAAEQSRRLVAEGFEHLHIYALNRAELALAISRLVGAIRHEAVLAA